MGIKAYIPFTNERRERLFGIGLANMANDKDGVVEVEWPDETKSFKPVEYDTERNRLVAEDGFEVKVRGLGSDPKSLAGVPTWNASAINWGAISTQAALIADRERRGVGYYEGPEALRFLFERYIGELQSYDIEQFQGESDEQVAADGGAAALSVREAAQGLANERDDPVYDTLADAFADAPDDLTVYDLDLPEDADAQVFSVRDPDDYDPYPVTREMVDMAVGWAEQKADDKDEWWSGFMTACAVLAGAYGLFRIVPAIIGWIMGAISGGGGTSIGMTIMPGISGIVPSLVGVLF